MGWTDPSKKSWWRGYLPLPALAQFCSAEFCVFAIKEFWIAQVYSIPIQIDLLAASLQLRDGSYSYSYEGWSHREGPVQGS